MEKKYIVRLTDDERKLFNSEKRPLGPFLMMIDRESDKPDTGDVLKAAPDG